ncbi:hypothetical protein OHA63_29235 [Streptomyces anulatus]|uniref:hypothetical protein n=1 Tax=Streptomyces anulatus TaxID=1892 RepID=UPI002E308050|nr:hypothetical protein [Streptomyces anulatus]
MVQYAGVSDGFTEVGQSVSQRADRVRELGDRAPGDSGLGVSTASYGARGEGCRGGEVGDESGDVASAVVESIEEVVGAGVHRCGERQLVCRVVDALGQRVQLVGQVVRRGQIDS